MRTEITRIQELGKHVLFDLDVIGGLSLKKQFGKNALAIFIAPPSIKELEKRLRNRSTENEESLKKRVKKATIELSFAKEFDVIVQNDNLQEAKQRTVELIQNFIC